MTSMPPSRTARVWAFIVLLAVVAAGVFALAREWEMAAVLEQGWATWWTLAMLFGLSERFVVHFPRVASASSHSLREIPTAFGLVLLPPSHYLLAIIVGTGAALLMVRMQVVRLAFNLALFAFEASLAVLIYRAAAAGDPLGLHGWLVLLLAVFGAGAIGAVLVDFVIYLAGDGFNPAATARAVVIDGFSTLANCSAAMLTVLLATRQPAALLFLGALAVVLFLTLRAYAGLAARYSRLNNLYRAVGKLAHRGEDALVDSARTVLREAVELAGTRRADVYLLPNGQRPGMHVSLAHDEVHLAPLDRAGLPDHVREVFAARAANYRRTSVAGKSGSVAAMAAPMWLDGTVRGVLAVTDPAFSLAEFDAEDLRMFELFAAHSAVTLHHTSLTDDLRVAAAHLRREVAARDYEARHDALTGLANRQQFLTLLGRSAARSASEGTSGAGGAVLLLALHDFRDINAALGHQAGDHALVEVARRLEEVAVGPVARLGGDQFAVFLPGPVTRAVAEGHARQLLASVRRPVPVAGTSVMISASVGVAIAARDADECTLAQADNAMAQAQSTADGVHTYVPEAEGNLARRLALAVDLVPALDTSQLDIWYQPKADALTGRVHSVEALLRWNHPCHGFVPPPEIVMLAERTGQIRRLTDYVLAAALAQANAWASAGQSLGIAVNVSTHDLHDRTFAATVHRMLVQHAVAPERLTLEITEGDVMQDPERCLAVLDQLAATGVRLSVDDFGTGYSSLAYLDRLPVHEVKIDRSFICRLAECPEDVAVIKSTIDLGHTLGLVVVAEGVENGVLQQQLADLGCDTVQGYHIGRPAPAHALGTRFGVPVAKPGAVAPAQRRSVPAV